MPKFRAWLIGQEYMAEIEAIAFRGDGNVDVYTSLSGNDFYTAGEECELIQSTGLHDKNGVEIFEGDILKVCDDGGTHNEVVFRDGQALVMNVTYQDFDVSAVAWALDCYHGSDDDDNEYPIVIGNIHQNPELLEA